MLHKWISILILGLSVVFGAGVAPVGISSIACILSVFYFWWAHHFEIGGPNLRLLVALIFASGFVWYLGGRVGLTGLPELVEITGTFEFNPSDLRRLKRSDRVAMRMTFDHKPTEEERYLRLGTQTPVLSTVGIRDSTQWAKENLNKLSLDQKIARIKEWFSNSFLYSLDSEWNTLDSFLFKTKKGYCQHFSFSTHELLRMSGEKSQMVYGYSGGSWNPFLRTLTYLDSDAHSWIEIFDRNNQTVRRLDPTNWVTQIEIESEPSSLIAAFPRIAGGLFICAFITGIFLLLILFRDPRLDLARALNTRGPILESLRDEVHWIKGIGLDYESLYFSKDSGKTNLSSIIRFIRFRLRVFLILVSKAFSGIR